MFIFCFNINFDSRCTRVHPAAISAELPTVGSQRLCRGPCGDEANRPHHSCNCLGKEGNALSISSFLPPSLCSSTPSSSSSSSFSSFFLLLFNYFFIGSPHLRISHCDSVRPAEGKHAGPPRQLRQPRPPRRRHLEARYCLLRKLYHR